jgi:hypothetical protein
MLSDAACAHETQIILGPLSVAAFADASRTQAASSSNCELDHDWQAQHPRRDRGRIERPQLGGTKSGRDWQTYARRPG